LESCPSDFDKQVTRYTNTQNRIDRRDFVALDIEQERIRGELQLEGVTYVYKSGETQPATATGFDLVEATIARACLQPDAALAVQAKREIGKLWDDIEKAPYKTLFNPSVAGPALWRAVQVVRQVDQALATLRTSPDGRRRLLSVHGNRFVTHVLLSCLPNGFPIKHQPLSSEEAKAVQELTVKVFDEILLSLDELYPDAYLASLFKNATKCQALKAKCSCPPRPAV
jgi:AIPR protein